MTILNNEIFFFSVWPEETSAHDRKTATIFNPQCKTEQDLNTKTILKES